MAKFYLVVLVAAAALTGCSRKTQADKSGAAGTATESVMVEAAVGAFVTLENSAYEAWKSKDAKFWDTFLTDGFVGYGSAGRLDKKSATREYTGADCELASYALSDLQMRPLGGDVALVTYKATVDGTCGGEKLPAVSRAAGIYVRDGGRWKEAFHAEAPVVDAASGPAKPVGKEATQADQSQPRDPGTDAMLAVEKDLWEAWRAHDGGRIEELTTREVSFINIFGTYFATRAEALKDWTGVGCDVKSVSVTDATGTMLSSTVGILRFNGAADGTCYGQKVGPIWGTSVYLRDGDAWKWTFGINLPAPPEAA